MKVLGLFDDAYRSRLGNIMMISEGRPGIDSKYMLKDGTTFH